MSQAPFRVWSQGVVEGSVGRHRSGSETVLFSKTHSRDEECSRVRDIERQLENTTQH